MSSSSLPPLPTLPTGRWQHHKGPYYEVLGVVRHSETLEPLVLYRPLVGDGTLWVRPFDMFTELVDSQGEEVPRFKPAPGAKGGQIPNGEINTAFSGDSARTNQG